MSLADPNAYSSSNSAEDKVNLVLRIWAWVVNGARPYLGWPILFCLLLIVWLPAWAAQANEWLALGEFGSSIGILGPLALLFMWGYYGWRHARQISIENSRQRTLLLLIVVVALGLLVLSQALTGWIPGPIRLFQALWSGGGNVLLSEMGADLGGIVTRLSRWWFGVIAGGATQDDLVFATFAGLVVWFNGILTGWLIRRPATQGSFPDIRHTSGLLAALPSLWLLMLTLLYGTTGRMVFVGGLVLALLLHVLLDQQHLSEQWQKSGTSFGEGLILDRLITVGAAGIVVFGLAAVIPSVRIERLADSYLQLYQPFNNQVEDFGQRLFPDLKATSRFRGASLADGLPNSFLLGAGPELSKTEVMRFRTDEAFIFEPEILEEVPTNSHYMRGGTLSLYDGLGWTNPIGLDRQTFDADDSVSTLLLDQTLDVTDGDLALPRGRKRLTQDIFLAFSSRGLYAAAEPLSFSVDYRLDQRFVGDQASVWGGRANPNVQSYSVVSAVPAVNVDALAVESDIPEAWLELTSLDQSGLDRDETNDGGNLLGTVLAHHLELPDTITDRTRALAAELTADADGPYAMAMAIESHLRTLEYDLTVSKPPSEVTDVADYFLFDLQRGYCDYYATAFTVLARLSGLPTRFATGFAQGRWDGAEGMWIVTEAEAHSWPEVYFPSYGWIPFEPTAGRPELTRVGVGPEVLTANVPAPAPVEQSEPEEELEQSGNWQMLIWLVPLLLLVWAAYRWLTQWRLQQQDPWLSVLDWGRRIGRPMTAGETALEYGGNLADFTLERYRDNRQDAGRMVAREITSMSEELTTAQYGQHDHRNSAYGRIQERWVSLRDYLGRLS